jgi:hypothetical protein
MTAQDHNKTLVILHSVLAAFFTLGLFGAPWIIAKNFRQTAQIPTAIVVFGIVFLMATLFWSTAIAMYRENHQGGSWPCLQ